MTTWILLRGLMRDSRHWGDFPERFSAAIGTAKIVALDLPGNGMLNRMASETNVAAMVSWCRSELAARGLTPPYCILAMSLGAMVATCWAALHGSEVNACVLINTSLRPSRFYLRLRPGNYGTLLRLAMFNGGEEEWEASIYRMTSNWPAEAGKIVPCWVAWRRQLPVSRANALRQLLAAWRFATPRVKPAMPLLILASTRDALVDVRCSRELAARWGVELREHPTAGHDLPLDDGDWVVHQISAWAKRSGIC